MCYINTIINQPLKEGMLSCVTTEDESWGHQVSHRKISTNTPVTQGTKVIKTIETERIMVVARD